MPPWSRRSANSFGRSAVSRKRTPKPAAHYGERSSREDVGRVLIADDCGLDWGEIRIGVAVFPVWMPLVLGFPEGNRRNRAQQRLIVAAVRVLKHDANRMS